MPRKQKRIKAYQEKRKKEAIALARRCLDRMSPGSEAADPPLRWATSATLTVSANANVKGYWYSAPPR